MTRYFCDLCSEEMEPHTASRKTEFHLVGKNSTVLRVMVHAIDGHQLCSDCLKRVVGEGRANYR